MIEQEYAAAINGEMLPDNQCAAPSRATAVLTQQISQSACVEGRDWGDDDSGELRVTSGCGARFGFR